MTQNFTEKQLNRQAKRVRKYFEERDKLLKRKKNGVGKFHHRTLSGDPRKKESIIRLIAQNTDRILIVASFVQPTLKTGLIDRLLVLATLEKLEPVIILNKVDLLTDRKEGEEIYTLYRSLGYFTLFTSTVTGEGIDILRDILTGHTSLLAGHSGVGKSSLLNALLPEQAEHPDVQEVSMYSNKGRHTTTSVRHYTLPDGSALFDLPGVKLASLHNIREEEIAASFPEFEGVARHCHFSDCLHRIEPGCAVKQAVDEGEITKIRYDSYLRILGNPYSED